MQAYHETTILPQILSQNDGDHGRKAWIGSDVGSSKGLVMKPGSRVFVPISIDDICNSVASKVNGNYAMYRAHKRSRGAQIDLDIEEKTGGITPTRVIWNALAARYPNVSEGDTVFMPILNRSPFHHVYVPPNTGLLQVYYWPNKFLRGRELLDHVAKGAIELREGKWEWLYKHPDFRREEDILGVRLALTEERQRIKQELKGVASTEFVYDASMLTLNGIPGVDFDYRASIDRQRKPIPEDLPNIHYPWVAWTQAKVTLRNTHALIIDGSHSASRFMKGGVNPGGSLETNWQLIGEYHTPPSEIKKQKHMTLIFADAA